MEADKLKATCLPGWEDQGVSSINLWYRHPSLPLASDASVSNATQQDGCALWLKQRLA